MRQVWLACALTMVASVVAVPGGTAHAAQTRCTVKGLVVSVQPGLSAQQPVEATYRPSHAGVLSCDGPIDGNTLTGSGTYRSIGRTEPGFTCTGGGKGWGVATMTYPTRAGTKSLSSPFRFDAPGVGLKYGSFRLDGDYFSGEFKLVAINKDCVTSPATKLTFDGDVTVHEFRSN